MDLTEKVSQVKFGALVGISGGTVSDLIHRGILKRGGTLQEWGQAYCSRLREQAAGRAASGALDLAQERAHLAQEQRMLTAVKRQIAEGEVAPIASLSVALAKVSAQIAAILEPIPAKIRFSCDDISSEALEIVQAEIVKARNLTAEIEIGGFGE